MRINANSMRTIIKDKTTKYILTGMLSLVAISFIVSIWLPVARSFRVVFGSFYLLFSPGLVLTFAFFRKEEIDIIERVALSFVLSITCVPLLVFYLNLAGVKINLLNVSLEILFIVLLGLGVIWWRTKELNPKSQIPNKPQ